MSCQRLASHSAPTRFVHTLFQLALSTDITLIVLYYAKRTSKSGRFPRQLFIVPASLIISTGLFFGAFAISNSESGREPYGAKIKFVLWGVALLVEVVAHIARSQMDITQGVQPRSHGSILERLNGITTIILGEVSRLPIRVRQC